MAAHPSEHASYSCLPFGGNDRRVLGGEGEQGGKMFWNFRKNPDAEAMLPALDRSQAIIEFHLDGTIIAANQNFIDAIGYTLAEIQGRHHRIFLEPTYRDRLD